MDDDKTVSVNITAKNLKYFAFASEGNHPMEYYFKQNKEKPNKSPETPADHHSFSVMLTENSDLIIFVIVLGLLFMIFVGLCWEEKTKTPFENFTF